MAIPVFSGIFPILVTPFDERGGVDTESLRRLVAFTIDAGVDGLGIALGSEVYKLTDEERDQVVGTVVDEARGRVPVVVNTGAPATLLAVRQSVRAEAAGAAAVMCTSPAPGLPAGELIGYFRAISDAVQVPVFVQATGAAPVAPTLLRAIGEACAQVQYAKVESAPPPRQVYDAAQACAGVLGIFGGAAGQHFLAELRRGSIGTMPWPSTPEAFVTVWRHWQAGDRAAAQEVFAQEIAPLLQISPPSLDGGHRIHKEILRRRGIIASAAVRGPSEELDPITLSELDDVCVRLGFTGTA